MIIKILLLLTTFKISQIIKFDKYYKYTLSDSLILSKISSSIMFTINGKRKESEKSDNIMILKFTILLVTKNR
jgi:hypothetical protein